MIRGRVKGRCWATKRIDDMPQGAFLDVELENGTFLIAFDPLGCGEDEQVMITQGSVAAGYFKTIKAPIDALIVGSLDEDKPRNSK